MWAPVFIAITALRRLGVAQLLIIGVFVFTGRLPGPEATVLPLLIMLFGGWAVLAWYRFTFELDGDRLVVERGVVSAQRLVIPLVRIQSVNIEQQLLHRPIGLVQVTLDTAGSDDAEVVISATSREIAEAMQRLAGATVRESRDSVSDESPIAAGVPPTIPPHVVASRTPSDLLKMALTNRPFAGLLLIAPLIGFSQEILGPLGLSWPEPDADNVPFLDSIVVFVVVAAILTLAAVVVLQVAWTFVTEFGLKLSKDGEVLRRESGLLERRSASSAISRIQQIKHDQTLLQRLVSHRTITLPTAGEQDNLRLPGAGLEELQTLRDLTIEPEAQVNELHHSIDSSAAFYWFRFPALGALAGALALGLLVHSVGFLLVLLVPIWWLYYSAVQRNWSWGLTDFGIATRSGVLSVEQTEATLRRAQRVSVNQNFFQQRKRLATFAMSTAEGTIVVPFIPLAQAEALRDRVLYAAAIDHRPWF